MGITVFLPCFNPKNEARVWLNANMKKRLKFALLVMLIDFPNVIHANRSALSLFKMMVSALQNFIAVIGIHVV
jgi:hypothetical protein